MDEPEIDAAGVRCAAERIAGERVAPPVYTGEHHPDVSLPLVQLLLHPPGEIVCSRLHRLTALPAPPLAPHAAAVLAAPGGQVTILPAPDDVPGRLDVGPHVDQENPTQRMRDLP